jgi:putative ABC transport system substrate-binding protein
MIRREFITLLGGAAAALPLAARAQPSTVPTIGMLYAASSEGSANNLASFRKGLSQTGFVENRNVAIEYRWAENQNDRLPALAADLVRRRVTVIAAPGSTPVALAAHAAITTLPIVFGTAADPVELGFVASPNRPSGNMTGVSTVALELGAKRLELLHEMVPRATTIALLVNPTSPALSEATTRDLQAAARVLGLNIHVLHASTELDFDKVFTTIAQLRAGALVIGADALFTGQAKELGALALRHRVPAIYQYSEFTAAGGLMSYGGSIRDTYHRVGVYVGRILEGEKPADLPVEWSTKVELIINVKTVKTLDLRVPLTLRARAEEVIE